MEDFMSDLKYGYEKVLASTSMAAARAQVVAALAEEEFGVLTEIDVSATLKTRLDVSFRPYLILGACNPRLAYLALEAEPQIGLLLPCNVVLQEGSKGVVLSIANPWLTFSIVENPGLAPIAEEADQRLARVMAALD